MLDRRQQYDDRPPYGDGAKGGYDDRRMQQSGGFEDRRPQMNERRPLMDQQIPGPRGPNNFDRGGGSNDMFSRRDNSGKQM